MDTKQFFISVSFAIVTTMLINYFIIDRFFYKDTQEIKTGQAFHVMPSQEMNKPLITEVKVLDEDKDYFLKNDAEVTTVTTDYSTITFSSKGAIITDIICKKIGGNVEAPFHLINSSAVHNYPFLVAFPHDTPLRYTLIEKQYKDGVHTVVYTANSNSAQITKRFKVYDTRYTIDIEITIDPSGDVPLNPRIIFPAPQLASGITKYDMALVNNQQQGIQRFSHKDIIDRAFAVPTLCGATDRYFVNAFIKSSSPFAQRCYFVMKNNLLTCIVEGPEVSTKMSWTLSWYCGPKEFEPLQVSDTRLTELLDYGWFWPLARPLLIILKQLYGLVHNFGLAIIILTVLLNLCLLPFTTQSDNFIEKSTELNKKLQYLEQRYKHDKDILQEEKSKLIQKYGIMNSVGCLSIIVQGIFFIGLNKVLSSSIELFHAPFYGWITDLSVADPYYVLPFAVFFALIIPILSKSSKGSAGNDIRQKATTFGLSLFFCGLFAQLSSGLVLYILTNILTRAAIIRIKKIIF